MCQVKEECIEAARQAKGDPQSASLAAPIVHYLVADMNRLTLDDAHNLIDVAVKILNNGAGNNDAASKSGLDILFLNHAISTLGFWEGSFENVTSASNAINVNYLAFIKLFSAAQKHIVAR